MSNVTEDPFEESGERDPDEASERRVEREALPELPAPAPREPEGLPARGPVNLAALDPDSAKRQLRVPIRLAASVLPVVDPYDLEKLVGTTIDFLAARSQEGKGSGLALNELADRAKIGRGRIAERFADELVPIANLTVRGVYAQAPRRVFYEELGSRPAEVGRRHNGVGTDKLPGQNMSLRLVHHSLGSSDRHCQAACMPLTTGTRWDRHSPRFGETLPAWALNYQGAIPQAFAEHLARSLSDDEKARRALWKAIRSRRARFSDELTADRFKAALSNLVVVPMIPFGPPNSEHWDHADVLPPGRDEQTIECARKFSKRKFLLACGAPDEQHRQEFERAAAELSVGELPWMYELGIRSEYAVQYRWSPKRHELGRYIVGKGASLRIWRLVGVEDEDSFWRMVALVERQSQVVWTEDCLRRWESDCKPGMSKAHIPKSCAGVRALLTMANAGIVDALRRDGANCEFA